MVLSLQNLPDYEENCPRGVCNSCLNAIVAAHELRQFVQASEMIWNKAAEVLSMLPDHQPPPDANCLYVHIEEDLSLRVISKTSNELITPLKAINKTLTKKTLPKASPPAIAKSTKPSRIVLNKKNLPRSGPTCDCPDCGQQYASPYLLNVHLQNGPKQACLTCGTVTMKGVSMQGHLLENHAENSHVCKECPNLFSHKNDLAEHVKTAHTAGIYTCGECGRSFSRFSTFESHAEMHTVRTCRVCGVQFTNRICYRYHRSQCEPDARPDTRSLPRSKRSNIRDPAQFTCDYCGKTYTSRPQLKNHIVWIHMDHRPHQCNYCGKRFYTLGRLHEHTIVHTRERNFECDICGARLVSKMAAVYHRRRHTGEKPYHCGHCDESFISASRRTEHLKRRHGQGPRVLCPECPSTFVRASELKKHLLKAHGKVDQIKIDMPELTYTYTYIQSPTKDSESNILTIVG